MKKILEIITLNRTQLRGTMSLLVVLVLFLLLKETLKKQIFSSHNVDLPPDTSFVFGKVPSVISDTVFSFDFNKVTENQLFLLGLNHQEVKNYLNFRKVLGEYTSLEQIRKIYNLSEDSKRKLCEFGFFNELNNKKNRLKSYDKKVEYKINYSNEIDTFLLAKEINNVSAKEIKKYLNIPSYLSERIIKYRDMLGGFYSVEQIFEVYGMEEYKNRNIKKYFYADSNSIEKKNLNKASLSDLSCNPYLSKKDASDIISFRQYIGKIDNLDQLIKNKVIDSSKYTFLNMYFTISND